MRLHHSVTCVYSRSTDTSAACDLWYVVQQEFIKGLPPAPVKSCRRELHPMSAWTVSTTLNPQISATDWLICFRNLKRQTRQFKIALLNFITFHFLHGNSTYFHYIIAHFFNDAQPFQQPQGLNKTLIIIFF